MERGPDGVRCSDSRPDGVRWSDSRPDGERCSSDCRPDGVRVTPWLESDRVALRPDGVRTRPDGGRCTRAGVPCPSLRAGALCINTSWLSDERCSTEGVRARVSSSGSDWRCAACGDAECADSLRGCGDADGAYSARSSALSRDDGGDVGMARRATSALTGGVCGTSRGIGGTGGVGWRGIGRIGGVVERYRPGDTGGRGTGRALSPSRISIPSPAGGARIGLAVRAPARGLAVCGLRCAGDEGDPGVVGDEPWRRRALRGPLDASDSAGDARLR